MIVHFLEKSFWICFSSLQYRLQSSKLRQVQYKNTYQLMKSAYFEISDKKSK